MFSDVADPPGRPTVDAFSARSVNISWPPPLNTHHSPIAHYVVLVRRGEAAEAGWHVASETASNATRAHVNDLQPFSTYSFRVAAVNAVGTSKHSQDSYYTMTLRAGQTTSQ